MPSAEARGMPAISIDNAKFLPAVQVDLARPVGDIVHRRLYVPKSGIISRLGREGGTCWTTATRRGFQVPRENMAPVLSLNLGLSGYSEHGRV